MAAVLWIITNSTTEITVSSLDGNPREIWSGSLCNKYIVFFFSQSNSLRGSVSSHLSCVTFILLHYFHLTNFFWMFVEGKSTYKKVRKGWSDGILYTFSTVYTGERRKLLQQLSTKGMAYIIIICSFHSPSHN